ncbi:MAG: hypothetical protein M3Z35_04875 [Nitrospirota bacterium]|nr:hypothetical protein [Nitrospirota bacterium]
MLTFQALSTGAITKFTKELDHPLYDSGRLDPKFTAELLEERWYGLKMMSYSG